MKPPKRSRLKRSIQLFPSNPSREGDSLPSDDISPPWVPPLCHLTLQGCGVEACSATSLKQCPSFNAIHLKPVKSRVRWQLPLTVTLLVLFGLLQIADGIVTYLGLDQSLVDEVNPLLNACAEFFGLGASIATLKLGGLAFITFLFFDRHKLKSHWITATLVTVVGFYGWVVANNVSLVLVD